MKIMRATLYTHNEWFKLQMCKDRFEGLLRIDSLKEASTPFLAPVSTSKSYADSCTNGSSQATVSSGTRMSEDGNSPTQASSRDVVCDESAILKVMVCLWVISVNSVLALKFILPHLLFCRYSSAAFLFTSRGTLFNQIIIFIFGFLFECRSFWLCLGLMLSICLHNTMEMRRLSFSRYLHKRCVGKSSLLFYRQDKLFFFFNII